MRISAVVTALTFLGCDDLDNAGNKEPSINGNSKVGGDEIANGLTQLAGESHLGPNNIPSTRTGSENRGTKSHKNEGSLELEPYQAGEEIVDKSSEKDTGPVSGKEQSNERGNPPFKNGFDLTQAKEIHEYMKALVFSGLKPGETSARCLQTGSVVNIGDGYKELQGTWGVGWWVPFKSEFPYLARQMLTERDFRGYRLQEKLFSKMNKGVFEIRRPHYSDPGKEVCNRVMVFEGAQYYRPCANEYEPGVAARALEILKELHHLGIVHGRVGRSFKSYHEEGSQWTPEDIDSLRLGDFSSAEFFINTDTGDLIPGKSPAVDLRAFAETFLPETERENFLKAINGKFNYDHWISHFRKLRTF